MEVWEGLVLGLVQGLTEFLPISSSGHLVLAQHALGLEHPSLFTGVMLHAGTLVAILMVFWRELYALGVSGTIGAVRLASGQGAIVWREDPMFRLLVYLALGTVPVAVVGLAVRDHIERLGEHPGLVGAILLVNGGLLLSSRRLGRGEMTMTRLTLRAVAIVGLAQTLALAPGISRSGITIITALWLGIERDTAGRLSFLLAVPAVFGATVVELMQVLGHGNAGNDWVAVLIGTAAATVSGYAAILILLRLVRRGRMYVFGPYCLLVGAAAVVVFAVV
jgi:undecaprenyl-diphosphatase